jgi:hypothetical protein
MTPADTQQQRLLERLRQAGEQPVPFAELRAGGIDFPAAVVSELELSGYAIERVYDAGGLSASVCSSQNPPKHPPHTAAGGGPGRTDSQPPYTPRSPRMADPPAAPDRQATRGTDRPSVGQQQLQHPRQAVRSASIRKVVDGAVGRGTTRVVCTRRSGSTPRVVG